MLGWAVDAAELSEEGSSQHCCIQLFWSAILVPFLGTMASMTFSKNHVDNGVSGDKWCFILGEDLVEHLPWRASALVFDSLLSGWCLCCFCVVYVVTLEVGEPTLVQCGSKGLCPGDSGDPRAAGDIMALLIRNICSLPGSGGKIIADTVNSPQTRHFKMPIICEPYSLSPEGLYFNPRELE